VASASLPRGSSGSVGTDHRTASSEAASVIELDVQLSSDGVPIVFHDDDLLHRTDAVSRFPDRSPWRVSELTAAQISLLDAGSWFARQIRDVRGRREPYLRDLTPDEYREYISHTELARYGSGDVHVPTLRAALTSAKAAGLLVNIEIKNLPMRYPHIVRVIVDAVRDPDMRPNVLVSSFDHEQIRELGDWDDAVATAVLTRDRFASPVAYVRDLCRADALHAGCAGDSDSLGLDSLSGAIESGAIRALREAGLLVNAWTENDPARMWALLEAGVSGIITDYPNRLARVLRDIDATRHSGNA
jgi:glycerophosphoryl diester phosphodiesterase